MSVLIHAAALWLAAATPPTTCMTDAFRVYFERDVPLGEAANAIVSDAAMAFQRAPEGARLVVQGYTDRVGSDAYNAGLSDRLARDVQDRLMAHGVPASAIVVQSFGESRPAFDTPDGQADKRNNRVEIWIRGAEPVCTVSPSAPQGPK